LGLSAGVTLSHRQGRSTEPFRLSDNETHWQAEYAPCSLTCRSRGVYGGLGGMGRINGAIHPLDHGSGYRPSPIRCLQNPMG
jgi:hypothetical protein